MGKGVMKVVQNIEERIAPSLCGLSAADQITVDAAEAMQLGCDGVLVNTAIANAKKPLLMAEAMKLAVIACRKSYLSGRISKTIMGKPSSPKKGTI